MDVSPQPQGKDFLASKAEAIRRLYEFIEGGLPDYAARRNFDFGPDKRQNVSNLSPYLRCRLITEQEVLQNALGRFPFSKIEKFVQEVFWRTYWKGWLEMRPGVWSNWLTQIEKDRQAVLGSSGWRFAWQQAIDGKTGIDCFDHWVQELKETNTLHNHSRMWFASIWIFTLRLPWSLGALFFWEHLLDGDPASNTLSWRWVAGLQTRGKHYVARASNISRFTDGRFFPQGQLNEEPDPLQWDNPPQPNTLEFGSDHPLIQNKWILYLHEEDLSPDSLPEIKKCPPAVIVAKKPSLEERLPVSSSVEAFRNDALQSTLERLSSAFSEAGPVPTVWLEEFPTKSFWQDLQKQSGAKRIVSLYCPVGETKIEVDRVRQNCPLQWSHFQRSYDSSAWPYATKGFFRFKHAIPKLITEFS